LDNVSAVSLYVGEGIIVHKPILDLRTNEYLRAEIESNDVTAQYQDKRPLNMVLSLALQSRFIWAADRIARSFVMNPEWTQITDLSKQYLERNLNNFVEYATARNARFVLVHIPDRTGRLEKELGEILQSFCRAHNVRYIRPALEQSDYLRMDGHLSASGARRVAGLLSDDWMASTAK